jgi:predicted alpha/beta-fold hydrolase
MLSHVKKNCRKNCLKFMNNRMVVSFPPLQSTSTSTCSNNNIVLFQNQTQSRSQSRTQSRSYTALAFDMYENRKVRGMNMTRPTNDFAEIDVVFTHGILGSKRNWRTPSKLLTNQVPNARVYTVDYRGHGKSHNVIYKTENNINNCVLDLQHLFFSELPNNQTPDVLVGHSFGGKVVLQYLQSSVIRKPRDVWILDSLPGLFDDSVSGISDSESVMGIFDILQKLPKTFSSSTEAISLLVSKGISKPVAQWLTINCRPIGPLDTEVLTSFSPDAVTWGFDLSVTW